MFLEDLNLFNHSLSRLDDLVLKEVLDLADNSLMELDYSVRLFSSLLPDRELVQFSMQQFYPL